MQLESPDTLRRRFYDRDQHVLKRLDVAFDARVGTHQHREVFALDAGEDRELLHVRFDGNLERLLRFDRAVRKYDWLALDRHLQARCGEFSWRPEIEIAAGAGCQIEIRAIDLQQPARIFGGRPRSLILLPSRKSRKRIIG